MVRAPTVVSVAALVALNGRRIMTLASGEEAKPVGRYRSLGHRLPQLWYGGSSIEGR